MVQNQQEQKPLFPNMEEPIKIPIDLAKEFVDWASKNHVCATGHICDRLADNIKKQLKRR